MQSNAATLSKKANIVMVADDDFFMRSLVQSALSEIVKIIEVADGDQVIEMYMQTKPAVLLLDIHMPKKNGKEVLKEVLAFDPDAYILILSADSNEKNVRDLFTGGAKGFITKPFNKDTLFKYIIPALSLDDKSFKFDQ